MDLATGAMGSLLPKLVELLNDEYKLQKGVKEGVKSLEKEMKSMHAALRKVAEVPRDQLDHQVKLWAGEVRELSFDMEDLIDKFLVHVDGDSETATKSNKLKRLTDKMASLFTKGKARHEIAGAIKDINKQVQEVANRRERYTVDNIIAMPPPMTTIDPRLKALYTKVSELVGIAGKRDEELMKLLSDGDSASEKKLKIVSVVGFGGLGKTTLVKTVYDRINGDFECRAFVSVGRNANVKKVLMDILIDLDMYTDQLTVLDEGQLINKLQKSLESKRYLIIIDDIWDKELWDFINLAFSRSNNLGSRLITTTRIGSVSTSCCSSSNDVVYQMKPLSDDDSKMLFYKRIFSNESECPLKYEEVSINMLKKCAGVPLAIVTIASLLASDQGVKHVDEWHALLGSIGRGLTENPSVEEMLKILSFSYYDLPSHLRTCLLYLSMFPEDHKIRKDQLIWMWIAESFVQYGKGKTSLFEIGETYFNELVNRNMIVPVYDDDSIVEACRVHDMVLDLILSLSTEENFVTVFNGIDDSMSSQSNVRRLSLQNARKGKVQTRPLQSVSLFKVRSVAAFEDSIDIMPSFSRFVVLRVLDLSGCHLGSGSHMNLGDVGSILHLRYLGLADTGISSVPEEVGKLQFLQVLDVRGNRTVKLPSTIINLRKLMCLLVDLSKKTELPDGLGKLASMEVLKSIYCDSLSIMKELGGMERLRELEIFFDSPSLEEALVASLCKMSNMQRLKIYFKGGGVFALLGEHWMPPRSLQEIYINRTMTTMPAWIRRDPSYLSQLSKLVFDLDEFRQEDLDNLGKLPSLGRLTLHILGRSKVLLVGADGFRCLTALTLAFRSLGGVVFQPGAMPRAESVDVRIHLRAIKEGADCDLDCYNLGNLPSLGEADVTLYRRGLTVGEAKQAKAALENALRAHPNKPTFRIVLFPDIKEGAPDDQVCPLRKE